MPLALNRIIKDPRYRARPSVRSSVGFPLPVTSSRKDPRRGFVVSRKNRGLCRQSTRGTATCPYGGSRLGSIPRARAPCRFREEFDSRTSARKKRFSDKQRRSRDLRTSIRRPSILSRQLRDFFRIASRLGSINSVNSARFFLFLLYSFYFFDRLFQDSDNVSCLFHIFNNAIIALFRLSRTVDLIRYLRVHCVRVVLCNNFSQLFYFYFLNYLFNPNFSVI